MKIIIPEKISEKNHNVGPESTLQFTLKYLGFFFGLVGSLFVIFWICSFAVIYFLSIEKEQEIFGNMEIFDTEYTSEIPENLKERYQGIGYPIYITDEFEGPNAFATLGAKIYLTQDLLDELSSDEGLDFVVGHEIGHIIERDVVRSMITNLPIQLVLTLAGFHEGSLLFQHTLSHSHSKYA
ncbi:M48 family metalloprotease, partial [Candidatus Gracilibacteria bacterium]|nr:M48 family metalloprotease [Candidatus Gracilibacteria bacterium]